MSHAREDRERIVIGPGPSYCLTAQSSSPPDRTVSSIDFKGPSGPSLEVLTGDGKVTKFVSLPSRTSQIRRKIEEEA